ncbi:DNA repair protein RAD16 [Binucleata daphniae]
MPEALVFVVNYSEMQYEFYKNRFDSKYFCCDSNTLSKKRKARYLKGGVFLLSQQTLLTDMINKVVDVTSISCLFVINAEKVYENDNTTFIVDYLNKNNTNAIVRGFTDKCIYLNFDTAMHSLQVNKAFMFPRFEHSVQNTISQDTNLVEKKLKLTKEMEDIQLLILETLKGLIREIKRHDKYNTNLNELYEDFDISKLPMLNRIINESIANYGYRSEVTKLGRDVRNYTTLITLLLNVDFKFFYDVLQQLWNEQLVAKEKSTWINLESGLLLMEKAVAYNNLLANKDYEEQKVNVDNAKLSQNNKESDTKKINAINNDISQNNKNINEDMKKQKRKCEINITKTQIDEIKKTKKYKKIDKTDLSESNEEFDGITDIKHAYKDNNIKTKLKKTTDVLDLLKNITGSVLIVVQDSFLKDYLIYVLQNEKITILCKETNTKQIHKYIQKNEGVNILTHFEYRLSTNIYNNIILTSPNLATMRKIEVLRTKNKLVETKVYTIYHKNSLEEQNFLNEVRNETNTFKKIIEKYSRFALSLSNTQDEIEEENTEHNIMIDFREMRCTLPYFLYKTGNKIQITTLETGDYVLGQNTAIERKAIPDFIQSINTGRLYLQAQMITYKYKNCFLLIEFLRRPCLADFYLPTKKISVLDKFVIFMSNFPRIKIIWSNNEILTTKILRNIQKKESTNTNYAKQINPILLKSLLTIPGIEITNYKKITNNYNSLREIANSDKELLIKTVGEKNGTSIYNFFNTKHDTLKM